MKRWWGLKNPVGGRSLEASKKVLGGKVGLIEQGTEKRMVGSGAHFRRLERGGFNKERGNKVRPTFGRNRGVWAKDQRVIWTKMIASLEKVPKRRTRRETRSRPTRNGGGGGKKPLGNGCSK